MPVCNPRYAINDNVEHCLIELTMQLAGRYFLFQAACHVCKLGLAYGLIIRQTYWQPLQSQSCIMVTLQLSLWSRLKALDAANLNLCMHAQLMSV